MLRDYFDQRTEALLEYIQTLMRFESPTNNKPLVDALGQHLQQELTTLGADVTVHPCEEVGDNILAKWPGTGKPILILSHLDTVWPAGTLDHVIPMKRDDYRLYGPGSIDMKGGIAIALEAIRGLQALDAFPERPIWFLMTTDEERGSIHSRDLIVETAQQCGLVLVTEGAAGGGSLKTWRKGIANYWVTATGRASHAGNAPEAGINAIIETAHQALAMHALNDLRNGTSVSVTQIEGGSAPNVIPAEATVYADVRFLLNEEAERVDAAIKGLEPATLGAELSIRGGVNRYPMQRDAMMIETFGQAKRIAAEMGMELLEDGAGGVSDANFTAAAGIPTLDGLGGQGDGAHSVDEHLLIGSLPRFTALMAALLKDWQFGS